MIVHNLLCAKSDTRGQTVGQTIPRLAIREEVC